MKVQEFLNETYKVMGEYQMTRPKIICNDGFEMSVQAGYLLYSMPREGGKIDYFTVEVGYPSENEELFRSFEFAEDKENYTNTVYPYVDIEIVDKVIEKHNGINIEETFKDKEE